MKPAVTFEHISKCFRIEPERPRSLQERFMSTLRRRHHPVEEVWVLRDVSFESAARFFTGHCGAERRRQEHSVEAGCARD